MKIILSLALIAATFVKVSADACTAYSVGWQANYTDGVAQRCDYEQMQMITELIESIVKVDVIASEIGKTVPKLEIALEQYSGDVTIDYSGQLAAGPDSETIVNHMTVEDSMEDMYYGTESENPSRHLQVVATRNLRGSDEAKDVEEVEGEWTPVPGFLNAQADEENRKLQGMDCGLLQSCRAAWCCRICGHCGQYRRNLQLSTRSRDNVVVYEPESETEGPTEEELFLQKVEAMQERVQAELEKKLRFLARHEVVPCLGNFWELEVQFEVHVEYFE